MAVDRVAERDRRAVSDEHRVGHLDALDLAALGVAREIAPKALDVGELGHPEYVPE